MVDPSTTVSSCLASIWAISTLTALLPRKRIKLSSTSSTNDNDNEEAVTLSDPRKPNLHSTTREALKEKLQGEIIHEERFKHKISRARILLSVLSLILLVARLSQITFSHQLKPEFSDGLLWFNTLILSFNLPFTISFSTCIHLTLLPTFSFLSQLFQIVLPPSSSTSQSPSIVSILSSTFFISITFICIFISSRIPLGPQRSYSPNPGSIPARIVTSFSGDGLSIYDRLSYAYCSPLISLVKKEGKIRGGDIPFLDVSMRTEMLATQFQGIFKEERKREEEKNIEKNDGNGNGTGNGKTSPWPLFRSMIKSNLGSLGFMTLSAPLVGFSFYAPAMCLNRIVSFLEEIEGSTNPEKFTALYKLQHGGIWCVLLGLVSLAGGTLQITFFSYTGELVVRIRTQLNAAIFTQTLKKKDVSAGSTSSPGHEPSEEEEDEDWSEDFKSKAQVIQLSTVDANRVASFGMHYFALALFPFELLIGGTFIYSILGVSALVGISISIITSPLTAYIAKRQGGIQSSLQVARDKRVSVLNEAFAAIRMVKFAAWEGKIMEKVMKLRDMELFYQKLSFGIDTILHGLFVLIPDISILVTFGWFVFVQKETLKPSVAFSAISVLLELRYLLSHVPELISSIVTSWVSTRRIATYLDSEEVELSEETSDGIVAIRSATIGWPIEREEAQTGTSTPSAGPFKLRDINIDFVQGKLNVVCGRLGTGKTLLLLALLHEAEISSGHVQSPRSSSNAIKGIQGQIIPPQEWIRKELCAYTPQNAFLTNNSIKNNILFGLPFDEKRYLATIKACQLESDLLMFEDGDESEIGENGIGLSGGQKTRISIARSFYSRAATLLLDDVLAAVDASTASRLVSDLLSGPLSQGRTIILVSHQVQLCAPISSKIVLLDEGGRIGFDGTADAFIKSDLYSGLHEDQSSLKADPETSSTAKEAGTGQKKPSGEERKDSKSKVQVKPPPKKLVEDEKMEEGSVKLSIYLAYIREGGWGLWICTATCFMVVNGWQAITSSWIRDWSLDSITIHRDHADSWWWSHLAILYGLEVVLAVISLLLLFNASLKASRGFFKVMLKGVLGANMRFHDTVSRGRLLNRFAGDMESMDEELAQSLNDLITTAFDLLIHLGVVWYTNGIRFVVLFAVILPAYVWAGIAYASATRELRRLESTTKSPILSAFTDLVGGVTVIRAFGAQAHTLEVLIKRTDESSHPTWFREQSSRWMSNIFNASSAIVALFASLFILTQPGITAGQAGFALSFLINIFTRIVFATRSFSDVQSRVVSVERIVEFATTLNSEPPSIVEPRPTTDWPRGEIVAEDLSLRYAPDLPEVLKKINFKIEKGQKIGLVGSTGSGKTSLATALFRFTDPSNGRILIDGIDITKVGLQDLRSRLIIIPQDPNLFSGPLRDSIDVFQEHTDAEVFSALRAVQLIGFSTSPSAAVSIHEGQVRDADEVNGNVFRDLSYPVAEGGSNLSNGQRQLVCLARALLKKASIIVFDEATSSVDNETEEILSATIREAFANSTVLTIAHRLRTIANYDLIMVMEQGSIVEMDSPKELLSRPDSKFYSLCQAAGKSEFEHLKKLADSVE